MRIMSISCPYPMPVSSRFARNTPSIRPTVGKFCTPANPISFTWRRKCPMTRNGSVPLMPARTGVRFTTGSTSLAISMTMALASPYASSPDSEPRPAMRNRPEL